MAQPTDSPTFTPTPATFPTTKPAVTPTLTPIPRAYFMGIHILHLDSAQEISLFKNTGALWTRYDNFNWDIIEAQKTDPPTYQWEAVKEHNLRIAAENAISVIGIVQFAPSWAQKYPGYACGPIKQAELNRFAQFMQAVVSRYSQSPYNLHYWELGNEPDVDRAFVDLHSGFGCWGEMGNPDYGGSYYAEMLKAVYPAIKAADPEARVLIGGLMLDCDPLHPAEPLPASENPKSCNSSRFLEGILNNGGGDYFDAVSFHSYDYYAQVLGGYLNTGWNGSYKYPGPALVFKAHYLRNLLADYGYNSKSFFLTEMALICGKDGSEAPCRTQEFELTKAYYVAEAYAASLAEGLEVSVWYNLQGWRASGLTDDSWQPLPAYNAFRFSAIYLSEAVFSTQITHFPGVQGYEFLHRGKRIWFLWAVEPQDQPIYLPEIPEIIYDVFGTVQAPVQNLNLNVAPVYIEWSVDDNP